MFILVFILGGDVKNDSLYKYESTVVFEFHCYVKLQRQIHLARMERSYDKDNPNIN